MCCLCSAVTSLLPKDTVDTYSKYTHFQNMSPPGLEAMVSRRGDKAEACGAWQQSGQINNCPFYSQREKNGAIQEQIHLSPWGFTRVSEKPHGQQSLSTGSQESSRISMDTWSFVHQSKLHCQDAVFAACLLEDSRSAQCYLCQEAEGETRGKARLLQFSSQSEDFLSMKERTAYLIVAHLLFFHKKAWTT